MSKPSLHEIAAMPLSETAKALREHYDPNWGKQCADESGKTSFYRVSFNWIVEGRFDDEIEAESEDEAKSIAEDLALDDAHLGRFEIDNIKIEKVGR